MAHMIDRSTWWVKSGGGSPQNTGDYRCFWSISYETNVADRTTTFTFSCRVQGHYKDASESGYNWYQIQPTKSTVYIGSSENNLKSIGSITTSQIDMELGTDWYVYPSDGTLKTTIKHNDDGSASFVFKGTGFGKGTAASTYSTANGNFPSIPSASVMGNISSFTIDDGLTVPVKQYVSSYYEKLEVLYGSTVLKTINAGNNVSGIKVKFTETELDTIYSTIKTGSSAQFTFRLTTYSNSGYSSKIGSSSTKNASGTFVTQLPTFSNFGYYDDYDKAVEATGSNQTIIARISDVYATISANQLAKANTRKASISHYIINGEKVDSTGSAISYELGSVTSNKITIQAVDTRGSASLVVTKEFTKYIDYNRVSVNTSNWSLTRRDNGVGRLIDISFEATWYQGSFGKTTNTLKPYVYYRNTEDGYWEDMNEFIKGASIGKLDETKIDTSTPGVVRYRGQLMSAEDDHGFDVQVAYDMFIGFRDTFTDEGLTLVAPYGQPAGAVYKNKMALGGPYDEMLGGTQLWGDIYINGEQLPSPKNIEYKRHIVSAYLSSDYSPSVTAWTSYRAKIDTANVTGDKLSFDSANNWIVIGDGVSKIQMTGAVFFDGNTPKGQLRAWCQVRDTDGNARFAVPAYQYMSSGTAIIVNVPTFVLNVSPGEVVELIFQTGASGTAKIVARGTSIFVEVIE